MPYVEKNKLIAMVEGAQRGDVNAFNEIYETFKHSVTYRAYTFTHDWDIAANIMQDTFIEVFRSINNLKEPLSFVKWMQTITYHKFTAYYKKAKNDGLHNSYDIMEYDNFADEEATEFIPETVLDKDDFKREVMDALNSLSPEMRSTMMLRYFDELSLNEISEVMDVPLGTVKSRINRGREVLMVRLDKYARKYGLNLHSIALFPIFGSVFANIAEGSLSPAASALAAQNISAATGISLKAVPTVPKKGFWSKLPTWAKAVSAATAGAVAAGGVGVAVGAAIADEPAEPAITTVIEEVYTEPESTDYITEAETDPETEPVTDGYDYRSMIDSFVPSTLNVFELTVGEAHSPGAAIWLDGVGGGYYSDNDSVVTVNKYGKVTAVGRGSAHVVIVSPIGNGSMYQVYRYDVYGEVPDADLSKLPTIDGIDFSAEIEAFEEDPLNTFELKIEQTHSPTASVWAKNGGKCYTSDEDVVMIDPNGTVTAVGEGTAYVIITSSVGDMFQIYKYQIKN